MAVELAVEDLGCSVSAPAGATKPAECAVRLSDHPAVRRALEPATYDAKLQALQTHRAALLWGTPQFDHWFAAQLSATVRARLAAVAAKTTEKAVTSRLLGAVDATARGVGASARGTPMITTVMTTAPLPSMPFADLLLYTARSLRMVPQLFDDQILIAFDGFDVERAGSGGVQIHPKCTQRFDDRGAYRQYVDVVKQAIVREWSAARATFVELPQRGCLSTLLRVAIGKVATPFVHVMQADMPIIRSFDLSAILDAMRAHGDAMQLVRLAFKRNRDHESFTRMVCNASSGGDATAAAGARGETLRHGALAFVRSSSWADNNHIATTEHYRREVLPYTREGDFPEHAIYCSPLHRPMGTWFLGDADDGQWVGHLDGRATRLSRAGVALKVQSGAAYLKKRALHGDPATQAAAQKALVQRTQDLWAGKEPATKKPKRHGKRIPATEALSSKSG